MKIGFDARMITHPGIGRYISNLLNAMFKVAPENEFILFGDTKKLSTVDCRQSTVKIVDYTAPIYSLTEYFFSPFSKYKLDILHIPHFNTPLQKAGKKLVITIHDLIYLKFPESKPFFKGMLAKHAVSHSIAAADKIIAVSENTKRDIIEFFPATKNKIEVIYEAADPCFRKIDDTNSLLSIKNKHNLPDKFILFTGSLKKHKNIKRLLDAYKVLKSKGIKHKLVIVGRYRPRESDILEKIKSTDAIYLGEVSSDDLVIIYNMSSVLAHPSIYEGFGLTVLEAMACGTPVVCSAASSLPEITSGAALLVDPYNEVEITTALYNVLTNDKLRNDLINKGFSHAEKFSWYKTATQTLEVYKSTCG